jgi:hypothetical protein
MAHAWAECRPDCLMQALYPRGGEEQCMSLDLAAFMIDPTPRRADGEYIAHARITGAGPGGAAFTHLSGDLAGFHLRDDAIRYATRWANTWLETRYG